jgi:hypothetical protein
LKKRFGVQDYDCVELPYIGDYVSESGEIQFAIESIRICASKSDQSAISESFIESSIKYFMESLILAQD